MTSLVTVHVKWGKLSSDVSGGRDMLSVPRFDSVRDPPTRYHEITYPLIAKFPSLVMVLNLRVS